MLGWSLFGVTALLAAALGCRLLLMRKGIREILGCLEQDLLLSTSGVFLSGRDPYLRRLAAQLERQLKQLRKLRQNYLEGDQRVKDAVVSISHDLRTPLTAISGYLELLENADSQVAVDQYVVQIQNRVSAIKQLVEELYRYFVETTAMEPVCQRQCINQILEETAISYLPALQQQGITPEFSITDKPVYCRVDKLALTRVLSNLFSNVLKYSDGDLLVSMQEDGQICFANSAKSLSRVDVNKLFDRFYTVDSSRQSTGLGLSISKLLTEKMQGTVAAGYEDGRLEIILQFPVE